LLPYTLVEKIYLYFSIGNGQPREPALCQLYRHTFVPCLYTRATLHAACVANGRIQAPSASAPIATHHNNGDDLDYQRVIRSMFWLKLYPCRSVPLLAPNPGRRQWGDSETNASCIIGNSPDFPPADRQFIGGGCQNHFATCKIAADSSARASTFSQNSAEFRSATNARDAPICWLRKFVPVLFVSRGCRTGRPMQS